MQYLFVQNGVVVFTANGPPPKPAVETYTWTGTPVAIGAKCPEKANRVMPDMLAAIPYPQSPDSLAVSFQAWIGVFMDWINGMTGTSKKDQRTMAQLISAYQTKMGI